MKTCTICNTSKDLSEFYFYNKSKADGTPYIYYNPYCKPCSKEKALNYMRKNPDKFKKYMDKENAKTERKMDRKKSSRRQREEGQYLEWQRKNKDKIREYSSNREHKKHNITKQEWKDCKNFFKNECAYCGLSLDRHYIVYKGKRKAGDFHKEHVDHEGLNDISNCVPSCKACNSSKSTMLLVDWYNESNSNYSVERLSKIFEWLELQSVR